MAEISNNQLNSDSVMKTGKPPYTFRAAWFLLLFALNLLMAAYYFHVIQ